MKDTITLTQVEKKLIIVRGESVLLDSDVAALYAVETREINQAVLRNPDKFPTGYIIQLNKEEWDSSRSQIVALNNKKELVKNFDTAPGNLKSQIVISSWGGKNKYPKAFTEKGLYMLATILKGKQATQTTIAIVEAFAKLRELARTVARLSETTEKFQQQTLMEKGGEIMADILGEGMKTTDSETSFELNLAVLKFKHIVKRKND